MMLNFVVQFSLPPDGRIGHRNRKGDISPQVRIIRATCLDSETSFFPSPPSSHPIIRAFFSLDIFSPSLLGFACFLLQMKSMEERQSEVVNSLVLQQKDRSLCAGDIKAVFVVTVEENHWEELGIGGLRCISF